MIKAIRTAFMTVALSFVSAMSFYASAQNTNVRVSGNVADESGNPLSGVVVYVKSGTPRMPLSLTETELIASVQLQHRHSFTLASATRSRKFWWETSLSSM